MQNKFKSFPKLNSFCCGVEEKTTSILTAEKL